jgi:hypothetical protein
MTQIPLGSMFQAPPGIGAALDSFENQFWFQGWQQLRRIPAMIAGSARDAGNTSNTKVLRCGLAMGGPIVSTDSTNPYKFAQWDITATDGSQYFYGFLPYSLSMYDQTGANQDRYGDLIVGGSVYSDRVIIASETAAGVSNNYGEALLRMAQQRFLFDKQVQSILPNIPLPLITLSVVGATPNTLTASYAGRIFTNTGDSASRTVNLPSALPGLGPFRFYRIAAQSLILDAGSNTFVSPGNVTADTLTLASAGAFVEVIGISTTQYLVTDAGGTVTPA